MEQQILYLLQRICDKLDAIPSVSEVEALRRKVASYEESISPVVNQTKAAAFLGTTSQSVIRLRQSGQLKATRVGGRWNYKMTDLERYRKSHTV